MSGELHQITARADGRPDLDDLVRLIRYLREHGIAAHTDAAARTGDVYPMRVRWSTDRVGVEVWGFDAVEGWPLHDGIVFVDTDGAGYDANREAL